MAHVAGAKRSSAIKNSCDHHYKLCLYWPYISRHLHDLALHFSMLNRNTLLEQKKMALAFEANNNIKHEQKKGVTQLGFIKKKSEEQLQNTRPIHSLKNEEYNYSGSSYSMRC